MSAASRSVPRRANCGAPWTTLLGVSRPKKPRMRGARRMELVPLREFYGHPFRAVDEHQLSRVEIHDLVPGLEPVRSELGNFSLDVFDRKTDVVHPNFVQVSNVRIGQRLGLPVAQELDFRSWGRVLEHERDVIGLDTWNAHVTGKWLSGNDDGHGFFEPQESKKPLGAVNIPHDDRAVVEMFYHASTPPCVPTAITPPVRAYRNHIARAESLSIRADWTRHGVAADSEVVKHCSSRDRMRSSEY